MGFLDTLTMVREIDEEATSLVAMCRLLDAAKKGAIELMRRYPEYRAPAQAVIDFAEDGESDIAGALAALEERMPRHRERGGST